MKIIGITSCSTGIAHTYMAAEGIIKAAEKKGYDVKVETQGSIGTENKLTSEDIENADLIIVASDVSISGSDRIEGLDKVYRTGANSFITDPDKYLQEAVNSL